MADKKKPSRAEQAVSDVKKSSGSTNSKSASKSGASKQASSGKKKPATKPAKKSSGGNVPFAITCFGLFALFFVIGVSPEGAILQFLKNILWGLLGQAAFYFSIPALLYLFIIHIFCRRTDVKMRSICTVLFVLLCGCIYHLAVQNQGMASGFDAIPDLYQSGYQGFSGGVFCGSLALLMKWAFGRWAAILISVIAAILLLLGAMEITVPSLIRAIANRPREEDEDVQE